MSDYFKMFEKVNYGGTIAVNILRKADIDEQSLKRIASFYPYTIPDGTRADILSNNYYDSPNFDWLIYLSNDVIDPYYDYVMTQDNFDAYIKKKYGSAERAMRRISHWCTNWGVDESEINVDTYENLPEELKKYWEAEYGFFADIVSYRRKREDICVETNRLVALVTTGGNFAVGDVLIDQNRRAEIVYVDGNQLIVKNVIGDFYTTPFAIPNEEGTVANVESSSILTTDISDIEQAYYFPVTVYEHEVAQNEAKKEIVLPHKNYTGQLKQEFKKHLK